MTSKSPVRSCDDVDGEALNYAEIKALCAGNPQIKEKMNLDVEVSKLKLLKADYQSQRYRLQDDLLQNFPKRIEASKGHIEGFKADVARLETNTHRTEEGISPMVVGDRTYTDRVEAGVALIEACKGIKTTDAEIIGSYRGFDMYISFNKHTSEFTCHMKGNMTHTATLSNDASGCISRINNAFDKIPDRLKASEVQLQTLNEQVENTKAELAKPFAFEAELAEKSARLAELDASLDIGGATPVLVPEGAEKPLGEVAAKGVASMSPGTSAQISAKGKPSLLEALERNAEKSRIMFGGGADTKENPKEVAI